MQVQVTLVFVLPVTFAVNVIDCVTITVRGAVVVPFGDMETTTTLPTPLLPPQPDRVRAARIAAVRNSLSVANFVLTSSPTNSVRATEPLPFSSSFPTQTFSPRAHRPGYEPVTLKSAADGEPERCRRLKIVQTARIIEHAAQLSLNIKPLIRR